MRDGLNSPDAEVPELVEFPKGCADPKTDWGWADPKAEVVAVCEAAPNGDWLDFCDPNAEFCASCCDPNGKLDACWDPKGELFVC